MGLLVLLSGRNSLGFPSSRFVYIRGPGTESCPDRNGAREAVKKRLGYDPFFPSADKTIIARVEREASKLRGEVELVDEHGTQVGRREFSAAQDECEQLVRAMALSISIAIDPKSAETYSQGPEPTAPADSAESQPPSPPVLDSEPVAPPAVAVPSRASSAPIDSSTKAARWIWSIGLGATMQFESMPQTALGATGFLALRKSAWSLAVEGELDAPATTEEQGVQLRTSGGALKMLPCGHWKWLSACQLTVLRWHSATGDTSGVGGSARSLALGVRLGAELPLSAKFGLLAYGDLLLTPLPVRLESEGRTLWETPVFSGGLGIAAIMHFR